MTRYRLERDHASLLPSVTITGAKLELGPAASTKAPLHPLTGFTCASAGDSSLHRSTGWAASIELDRQGRTASGEGSRWRSGESLKGFVRLSREVGRPPGPGPTSVICRVFSQSTTIFWVLTVAQDYSPTGRLGKFKPSLTPIKTDNDLRVEWNRAYVGGQGVELWRGGELAEIAREVDADFAVLNHNQQNPNAHLAPLGDGEGDRNEFVLPFEFALPSSTKIHEANGLRNPPSHRAFSHAFVRSPPPSLPAAEGKDGCVEWTVEALVRFADDASTSTDDSAPAAPLPSPTSGSDELPSFADLSTANAECMSAFGLMTTSDSVLVHRVVFPFEPSDLHAQDLYSAWRPNVNTAWAAAVANYNGIALHEIEDLSPVEGEVVPSFGRDARDEALGGSNMGPLREMKGSLVGQYGGREMWSSYEKRMPVKNKISRLVGWTRTETSLAKPAMITRHASSLKLLLYISFDLLPSREASKLRPTFFDNVLVTLSRRTLTRGGREDRPHFLIEELRRQEINLSENGRSKMRLNPGEGKDLELDFDLQSEGFVSVNGAIKHLVPVKDMGLSFRTPNVECEYIVACTISPVGAPPFYLFRVPLQIIAGDLDAVPAFEEGGEPPVVAEVPLPLGSPGSSAGHGPGGELPPGYFAELHSE